MKTFLNFLLEARSHPELNRKIGYVESIKPYAKDPKYYISFRSFNKIGINPNNIYNTPIGIYAYPLKEMWETIKNNEIPFMGNNPASHVVLLKINPGVKMLTNKCTNADVERAWNILNNKYDLLNISPIHFKKKEEFFINSDYNVKAKTNFQRIWFLTENVAELINTKPEKHRVSRNGITVLWSDIMRKDLGYGGAEDRIGKGIIHPNEPIQAVFFSKDAFKVVDMFMNKRYDPLTPFQQKEIEKNIKNSKADKTGKDKLENTLKSLGKISIENNSDNEFGSMNIAEFPNKIVISNIVLYGGIEFINKSNKTVMFVDCKFTGKSKFENVTMMGTLDSPSVNGTFVKCKFVSPTKFATINIYENTKDSYTDCKFSGKFRIQVKLDCMNRFKNCSCDGSNNNIIYTVRVEYWKELDKTYQATKSFNGTSKNICIGDSLNPGFYFLFNIDMITGKKDFTEKDFSIFVKIAESVKNAMFNKEIPMNDLLGLKISNTIGDMFDDIKRGKLSLEDI